MTHTHTHRLWAAARSRHRHPRCMHPRFSQMDDGAEDANLSKEDLEFDEMDDASGVAKSSFVRKLFELVNNEPDEIVGFIEDGTAFEVRKCHPTLLLPPPP